MKIPESHPRYHSLVTRQRIIEGVEKGITSMMGLIAQGRGEAFDYLLGERTITSAESAIKAAVASIILAENPVFSVNGNAAVLAPEAILKISKILNMTIEINLFHRTEKRVKKIYDFLKEKASEIGEEVEILGLNPKKKIPYIDHPRALCTERGIYKADLVFVPLEDGDRVEALKRMGKFVVVVDLNPLSRSAKTADVTIVDNLVRVLPRMEKTAEEMKKINNTHLKKIKDSFSNKENLSASLEEIRKYLKNEILPY